MASKKKPVKRAAAVAGRPGEARKPKAGTAARKAARGVKKAPAKKAAGAKRSARSAAPRTKTAAPKAAAPKAGAKAAPPRKKAPARRRSSPKLGPLPEAIAGLSEEDQIRSAKYLPRELPKRLFEEDRFLFPESYGVNRIRLLVRDPEWIFAYWDVSPATMKELASGLGERALALSRLTLRVVDPVSGGSSDILLPPGARWWYVRTDSARRTYRAELGVTLPSGAFRRLAESNTVVTPRVGPSPERARRRLSYREARDIAASAAEAAGAAERETGVAREPWAAGAVDGAAEPSAPSGAPSKGGASDSYRPGGASDAFRPGASDAFKR